MRRLDVLRLRLRSVFFRKSVERELEKELRFHLEEEIGKRRADGLSAEEATISAAKRLGGVAQIQEECRDMRQNRIDRDCDARHPVCVPYPAEGTRIYLGNHLDARPKHRSNKRHCQRA